MNGKKIFITEDEFIVSKNLQYKLEELGYNVTGTAPSGEMAIEQIRKDPPDLVLMDIMLAGDMDGIDTAKMIRAEFEIPIIFLTAYSSEEISKRASLVDPYAYILKPYEERELEINISIALYKAEAEKKIIEKQKELIELNKKLDSLVRNSTHELNKQVQESEKLQEWSTKFLDIVDATYDFVIIANTDGIVEYANNRLTKFLGLPKKEVEKNNIKSLIFNQQSDDYYDQIVQSVLSGGGNYLDKIIIKGKDAKMWTVDQIVIPLKNSSGSVTHFASVCRNI